MRRIRWKDNEGRVEGVIDECRIGKSFADSEATLCEVSCWYSKIVCTKIGMTVNIVFNDSLLAQTPELATPSVLVNHF